MLIPIPAGTVISSPSMNTSRWEWTWLAMYSFGAGSRPASTVSSSGFGGAGQGIVGPAAADVGAPPGSRRTARHRRCVGSDRSTARRGDEHGARECDRIAIGPAAFA